MKDITNKRIYAQLRPDKDGLTDLLAVQNRITATNQGRLVGADELHLTLIHFGIARDVLQKLMSRGTFDEAMYEKALQMYVHTTEQIMSEAVFVLPFDGYELFGRANTTLVARFGTTGALIQIHAELLEALRRFFRELNVTAVNDFMRNDHNFKYTLGIHPHVTLYKGYRGDLPPEPLDTMTFAAMKVVY